MNFTLTILGSASALPFSDRNPSAQALSVHGRLFLIDCGEGTQQRMRQEHLSFLKVEAVFISHIHGDHCFGLFGVLSTMSLYGRVAPLHIFGPQNLGPVIKFYLSYFGQDLGYEIIFHPLTEKHPVVIAGKVSPSVDIAPRGCNGRGPSQDGRGPRSGRSEEGDTFPATKDDIPGGKWQLKVTAFPLNHKIDCYGYRFDEVVPEPSVRSVPVEGRGRRMPRSYAYVSDTAPFAELSGYVKGVDLLYHEATYPSGLEGKAVQYFHSTAAQAALCAKEAEAGRLLIGHFSSRVKDVSVLQEECRDIFPETTAVNDGDVFEIPYIREYEKMLSDNSGDAGCACSTV